MKIVCPDCRKVVPAENVALDAGWAKCPQCFEVFDLEVVLPGYKRKAANGQAAPPERPFDAWAVLERTPERLLIHIPEHGMRAGNWAGFAFALFWLGFIAFWTAGALGVFFGQQGPLQWENVIFAAFSTPFWLVGFGMLGGVLWSARNSRTVRFDASALETVVRCLLYRRRRTIDRALVQHARPGVHPVKSDRDDSSYSPYSAEIIFEKGSFRLPCTTLAEQAWLVGEINDFLQTVPYREPAFAGATDDRFRI